MARTFLPHQQRAWDYVSTRDKIALFMRMRLGKSIVTIRWAKHRLPADANILIVGPLSVLPGWKDELALEGESATILAGTSRQKMRALESCETRWVLINPEGFCGRRKKRGEPRPSLSPIAEALTSIAWDCVILDESTFITNPKSAITQLIRKEFKDVRCKAVLAGEPAPESPLDFFEQFAFLHGVFMGARTFYQFRYKYFQRPAFEWIPRSSTFKKTLRDEVRRLAFVLTARQAGVEYLRIYQRRYVRLEPDKLSAYRETRRSFSFGGEHETKFSIVTAGWLSRLAGGCAPRKGLCAPFSTHKIDELVYLVRERYQDEPLVVWFRYTDEIRFCYERLVERGINPRCIHGKTPLALRHAYVKAFSARKFRVLFVQTRCARFGLDLSAANTAIFYSNWWEWLTRAQAEARLEHPTKLGATLLYVDLLTERTMDEDVLDALKEKKISSRYFLQKVMVKYAARCRSWGEDDGVLPFRVR